MTKIKLPTPAEAEELLPTKENARIHKVGRRVALAKAFAAQYLDLTEISLGDLLDLTEFLKESVQRLGTQTPAETVDNAEDAVLALPEVRPQDAFFGTPQCTDPTCRVHGENLSDDTLRVHIAEVIKSIRSEIPANMYAKMLALLEDPRTELIRTPLGILLRAASSQGTPSGGNTGLN
jgi:hypothetical protein